jgi:hypothetical protein
MVQDCVAARSTEEEAISPERVLEAAITVWSLLEATEEVPATSAQREQRASARHRFQAMIAELGLSEEELAERLRGNAPADGAPLSLVPDLPADP